MSIMHTTLIRLTLALPRKSKFLNPTSDIRNKQTTIGNVNDINTKLFIVSIADTFLAFVDTVP